MASTAHAFPGLLPSDVLWADAPDEQPVGRFGVHPAATPRYARNIGERTDDGVETMARLYVATTTEQKKKLYEAVTGDTASRRLLDAVTGTGYVDFNITQSDHGLKEKYSVDEVLSDNYVAYFFGPHAPVFNYSGWLLNSVQDDQLYSFLRLYRQVLSGTQLARYRLSVQLAYDGFLVRGALTDLSWQLRGENELYAPFGCSVLVKDFFLMKQFEYGKHRPARPKAAFADFLGPERVPATEEVPKAAAQAASTSAAPAAAEPTPQETLAFMSFGNASYAPPQGPPPTTQATEPETKPVTVAINPVSIQEWREARGKAVTDVTALNESMQFNPFDTR